MEKRRKRRSAEDVEKSIWEAATTLIQRWIQLFDRYGYNAGS